MPKIIDVKAVFEKFVVNQSSFEEFEVQFASAFSSGPAALLIGGEIVGGVVSAEEIQDMIVSDLKEKLTRTPELIEQLTTRLESDDIVDGSDFLND